MSDPTEPTRATDASTRGERWRLVPEGDEAMASRPGDRALARAQDVRPHLR